MRWSVVGPARAGRGLPRPEAGAGAGPAPRSGAACTDKFPKRVGGEIVFRQRKGKGKLTLQCPPGFLALLKAQSAGS
jgi:hypothetical protein